jgi:hypothetical protein
MPTAEPKPTQNEQNIIEFSCKKKIPTEIKPKLTNHNPQIQSKAKKKKTQPCNIYAHPRLARINPKQIIDN